MKFRDPKTGEVFEDIEAARVAYCESFIKKGCNGCLISIHSNGTDDMYCGDFPEAYPIEAAHLMGMEVITDKEEPMEKTSKPRFTEEEVAVARSLQRVWPDGKLLRRAKADLVLTSYHYGFTMPVPQDMFNGLCQGQSITLCDIVGGEP